jgi:cation diffusion facilitator family transporter
VTEHTHARGDPHSHHDDPGGRDDHHTNGVFGLVRSLFAPHSHDAIDSIDQALVGSDDGMKTLKISFGVLAATALVQLVVVLTSSSVALLGDTVHNVADSLTALPLALAFWLERKPPTRRYTFGYGRAEDLAGMFVVAVIAASAAFTAWEAIDRLIHPQTVHHVGWVVVAGVVGFAGNEIVAVYRTRVGRKIGSAALVADGYHARADGITSLAVVVGALGVAAGWPSADPVMGLVITVAILVIVKSAARDIYRRLMDSVDPTLVDHVEAVLAGVDGVEAVETVRIRWIGHELRAEAVIVSDGRLPLAAAHAIAEVAHHRLLHEVPRLTEALIHSDPGTDGRATGHDLTAHHFTP